MIIPHLFSYGSCECSASKEVYIMQALQINVVID